LNSTKSNAGKETEILLICDNPGVSRIFDLLFKEITPLYRMTVATDGKMALHKLFSACDGYSPDAILLSRNLPRLHSSHVLTAIKTNILTNVIPVFLLGLEFDSRGWKGQKPDYYGGRLDDFADYVRVVRMLESILNPP
jgi:CheY-like chemotaxis protein